MQIAIIDYNSGNVQSVLYAMERLGVEALLTDDHETIRSAPKVIFPGVGEANTTMQYLQERGLDELIRSLKQPVLGICLGMQLLCDYSEENDTPCLGIIPQKVVRFQPKQGEKVPHMGWNSIRIPERHFHLRSGRRICILCAQLLCRSGPLYDSLDGLYTALQFRFAER